MESRKRKAPDRLATIAWERYKTYKDASGRMRCLYLTMNGRKPLYVGVCIKSVFGGSQRKIRGAKKSPRYGTSYAHWIDAFLLQKGRLYVGTCKDVRATQLKSIESTLIAVKKPKFNNDNGEQSWKLRHVGSVPTYLRQAGKLK
jgi:hypothetical protein